jgi:nucleoid DNA-binding protein
MSRRRKSDAIEGRSFRKDDLLRMTARMAGVRWDVTEKVINCLFASLRQYIMDTQAEGRISIKEFGTFLIDKKKAYEFEGLTSFRGPRERISLPARKRIRFKPCGVLEDHCNTIYVELPKPETVADVLAEEVASTPPETSWELPEEAVSATAGLYNPSTEEAPVSVEKDIYRED